MGRHFEVRAASMAKTAAKKSKIYGRYGREIYLAAKNGVPDPAMNVELKRIIAQAKGDQVPADVINRAIEKAKGGSGDDYSSVMYEGFGPAGSTLLVECLTDNANRSLSDVRTAFNKSHGKLGSSGTVSFNYDRLGLFVFKSDLASDDLLMAFLDRELDVVDVSSDQGIVEVLVQAVDYQKARDVLDELLGEDMTYEISAIQMIPKEEIELADPEDRQAFEKLVSLLEDIDDVQNVYHNVNLMGE